MENIIKGIQSKVIGINNNLIAICLDDAINRNDDALTIISNIKDMAKDNYVMVRSILGKELLTDILNFKNK